MRLKDVESVVCDKDMMAEVFFLMNEMKAQAMSLFRLALSEIDMPDTSEAETAEQAANLFAMEDKKKSQFETFFVQN